MQLNLFVYELLALEMCESLTHTAFSAFSQPTKATDVFTKTFILIGNGMILIWAHIEWVLNPLGNIHKNQNKTPLKWIYFYYSMVFVVVVGSFSRCLLLSWVLRLTVDVRFWMSGVVCNLYHPKILATLSYALFWEHLASNGRMNFYAPIDLMTKLRVLNMVDMVSRSVINPSQCGYG